MTPNSSTSMMILIAGPYRSGTNVRSSFDPAKRSRDGVQRPRTASASLPSARCSSKRRVIFDTASYFFGDKLWINLSIGVFCR
jgi:hypothetical protein